MLTFFRRALPLLSRPARRRMLIVALLMVMLAGFEAVALLLIAPLMSILTSPNLQSSSRIVSFVSRQVGNPPATQLALGLGVATVVLYVVKSVASVLTIRWATGVILQEEAQLVRRMMASYLHEDYRRHLEANSSEWVRTLTIAVRNIFQMGFVSGFGAVGDVFSVVLVAAILVVANPLIALAAGAYFGAVTLLYQRTTNRFLTRRVEKLHRDQAIDFQTIGQALAAVKEIKVKGVEDVFTEEVYRLRRGLVPAYRSIAVLTTTPRYILEMAMVGAAATIAAVAYSTESLTAATAALGLFLVGGFRIVAPLNKIIFGNAQARAAMPSLEQVISDLNEVETAAPPVSGSSPAAATELVASRAGADPVAAGGDPPLDKPAGVPANGKRPLDLPRVEVEAVTFSYRPGVPVLRDVTFAINPGDSLGLVGGSGAGKSTLFDILLGLLPPEGGRVLIDGAPIDEVRRSWQDRIGYVPQATVIFDDTVRANVAFGARRPVSDEAVWEALRKAQLEDAVRDLPEGLDTRVGEGGTRLSGGQRQRLGIARALFGKPQILMFDEATSALDNETEHRLTEVLESLKGQITMVLIAHRLSTVRRCDRVLYLDGGRLVAEGTFSELNESIPGFARLVELSSLDVSRPR